MEIEPRHVRSVFQRLAFGTGASRKRKFLQARQHRKGSADQTNKEGKYLQTGDPLVEYVQQHQAAQRPVTTKLLKIQVMQLALQQGVTWRARRCWITNFMMKKGLSLRW